VRLLKGPGPNSRFLLSVLASPGIRDVGVGFGPREQAGAPALPPLDWVLFFLDAPPWGGMGERQTVSASGSRVRPLGVSREWVF